MLAAQHVSADAEIHSYFKANTQIDKFRLGPHGSTPSLTLDFFSAAALLRRFTLAANFRHLLVLGGDCLH